jgi:hypothetical protein
MQVLFINNCHNLKKIDFNDDISDITVSNCTNFINYKTSRRTTAQNKKLIRWLSNSYFNIEFKMMCKIKTWYKNITNKSVTNTYMSSIPSEHHQSISVGKKMGIGTI